MGKQDKPAAQAAAAPAAEVGALPLVAPAGLVRRAAVKRMRPDTPAVGDGPQAPEREGQEWDEEEEEGAMEDEEEDEEDVEDGDVDWEVQVDI